MKSKVNKESSDKFSCHFSINPFLFLLRSISSSINTNSNSLIVFPLDWKCRSELEVFHTLSMSHVFLPISFIQFLAIFVKQYAFSLFLIIYPATDISTSISVNLRTSSVSFVVWDISFEHSSISLVHFNFSLWRVILVHHLESFTTNEMMGSLTMFLIFQEYSFKSVSIGKVLYTFSVL